MTSPRFEILYHHKNIQREQSRVVTKDVLGTAFLLGQSYFLDACLLVMCILSRVVYRIGIFRSVLVRISRYLPYRYQRKSRSVHVGIIFFGGNPFFPQKGGTGPLFEKKGGTGPLFDKASPPFAEKRSSLQISNTDRKYRPPSKSDTGKIPIPKKLLVTPWFITLVLSHITKI
jgi:hypothetical protein